MILRRSSSRCSRKPIAGIRSSSLPCEGRSAAISGIGRLGGGFGLCGQLRGCGWLGGSINNSAGRNRTAHRIGRRQVLWCGGRFALEVGDLGLDLRLELVGGPLKLVQCPANLPADLWKLLRPKQNKSPDKNENHLWKTEIHAAMILRDLDRQQRRVPGPAPKIGFVDSDVSSRLHNGV